VFTSLVSLYLYYNTGAEICQGVFGKKINIFFYLFTFWENERDLTRVKCTEKNFDDSQNQETTASPPVSGSMNSMG
jgi:hypothetical protein